MKVDIVLREEKRVVGIVADGTMIEFEANPKSGIMPPWALLVRNAGTLNVTICDLNGNRLTPGSMPGQRQSCWWPLIGLFALVGGVAIGVYHQEISEWLAALITQIR